MEKYQKNGIYKKRQRIDLERRGEEDQEKERQRERGGKRETLGKEYEGQMHLIGKIQN